jgi:hypothetical protein
MIKNTILILFLFLSIKGFSQFPINPTFGNTDTRNIFLGAGATKSGFQFIMNFNDTSSANSFSPPNGGSIKNLNGFLIRVNDTLWMRAENLSKWIKQGGSGGGTLIGANQGTTVNGTNVQLGQSIGAVGNPSAFTQDREVFLGTFPNRYKLSFISDISAVSPTIPISKFQIRSGGVLDLIAPGGPGININELDSANVLGNTFPSVAYTMGYRQILQVFTGLHWTSTDKHYDIADVKSSTGSTQYMDLQFNGASTMDWRPTGETYMGLLAGGTHRVGINLGLGTLSAMFDVNGTARIRDSSFLFTRLGTTADSVFTKGSDGSTRAVAQSSIIGAIPTWQQTLTAGSTLNVDNTVSFGTTTFAMSGTNVGLTLNNNTSNITLSAANGLLLIGTNFISMTNPATSNDTTVHNILTYNTSTNHIEKSNWGNFIPTMQQVFDKQTQVATLTTDDVFYFPAHQLLFQGDIFRYDWSDGISPSTKISSSSTGTSILGRSGTGNGVSATDSIYITPYLGKVNIDSLRSMHNANDSMVVWQPTTGAFGMKPIPTAAGTVTSIATSNGTGITGGTITSSGTLAIDTTSTIRTINSSYSKITGQAQKNLYGTIVNQNTFASTTGYTINGSGTFTATGGHISASNGNNDYARYAAYNLYTGVEYWDMSQTIVVTGTGTGESIGIAGTYNSMWAYFNFSDSILRIQISTASTQATSSKLNFAINDSIEITFHRYISTFTATARNKTTNSAPVYVSCRLELTAAAVIVPGQGYPAMAIRGGTYDITSFSFSSTAVKQADVLVIGDSKSVGYYASSFLYRWVSQMGQKMDAVCLGGSSSETVDWLRQRPEVYALNPKLVILTNPSNDLRAGVSTAVTHAEFEAFKNSMDSAGIKVLVVESWYEPGQDNNAWNTYLAATFSPSIIVSGMYPLMKKTGALSADNVHPTAYGDSLIYNQFLLDGKITPSKGFQPYPPSNIDATIVGTLLLHDNPGYPFTQLQFGGTTSASPMLQINGTTFELKGADNVSFGYDFRARNHIADGGVRIYGITGLSASAAGNVGDLGMSGSTFFISSEAVPGGTFNPMTIRGTTITLSTGTFTGLTMTSNTCVGFGSVTTPNEFVDIQGSNTSSSSLRIRDGVAPTTKREGQIWKTTDDFFAVISTGTAVKHFILDDGTNLTSGRVPFATTNGRLTDNAALTWNGTVLGVTGNLTLSTAGNKINIATGTNASVGTATLSGGTVTVSTTAVTASSKIFLTDATTGALTNVGSPTVGTIVAGTSFVINSTNVLDNSAVNWIIIN